MTLNKLTQSVIKLLETNTTQPLTYGGIVTFKCIENDDETKRL